MGRIIQLPKKVAGKIAAGEIVERPVSVVKELVENSIDAGADQIKVSIEDGGKKKILVEDNGDGILKEDFKLIFKRHSTSKIKDLNDLQRISSLGFRGEALSSIAEISKITIISATEHDEISHKINYFDGSISSIENSPYKKGTTVIVENLFYNLPVRQKFMRTDRTETMLIRKFLKNIALANENITFSLDVDGSESIFLESVSDKKSRFYQIFGNRKDYESFFEIKDRRGDFAFYGYFIRPGTEEYKKPKQLIFINNRLVKERTIIKAIYSAYDTYLQKKVKPSFIIFIKIPYEEVEVNIHPSKAEVKFSHPREIFNIIRSSIRNNLENYYSKDKIEGKESYPIENKEFTNFGKTNQDRIYSRTKNMYKADKELMTPPDSLLKEPEKDFKLIGQFLDSYIIVEKNKKLLIVDQHNADERIKYDALTEKKQDEIRKSKPLFPIIFEIRMDESIEEKLSRLKDFSWDIELWGDNSISIKKYPYLIKTEDIKDFIYDYLERDIDKNPEKEIKKLIACKAAIKINHPLTEEEMNNLVISLFKTKNPYLCPHSRPIIFEITEEYIKKELKR